jgi:hypothetical protein
MKIFWLDMKNILIYNIGEQVLKQAICLDGYAHYLFKRKAVRRMAIIVALISLSIILLVSILCLFRLARRNHRRNAKK